jgi:putative ABC transport system permease protein
VELAENADVTRTVSEVQGLLRSRHGQWRDEADDVIVRDFAQLTGRQSELLTTVTWVVFVTSGLLLAVGMVGIMTLMLLVVRQRRSEIGLRRALGAVPADVAFQFFLEGSGLAAAGVLAGCVLGFGTAIALARGWGVEAELDLMPAAMSLVVSLGSGAVACALPAILAARIEPAMALCR